MTVAAGPRYLLDANVFIEAAQRYYAFDLFPSFWMELKRLAEGGLIGSIDRVREELARGKDDLARWATSDFADAFAPTNSEPVIQEYRRVMAWVEEQGQYTAKAKVGFANGADGWLVAYAAANACTVVTQETPDPNCRNRVKIPNACLAFEVTCIDTFCMLRELRVTF